MGGNLVLAFPNSSKNSFYSREADKASMWSRPPSKLLPEIRHNAMSKDQDIMKINE